MSEIPTVYPAAPPAVYFTMGGWSPAGVILATTIAVLTFKVLGFIGYSLSLMFP
jgi:hypothetical protein